MTLDEQIEKLEQDLAHFEKTNQWLAVANAIETLEKFIKVKEYLGNRDLSTEAGKTLAENWAANCKPEPQPE